MHNVGNTRVAASYSKNATIESHAKLGNDVSLAVSNEATLAMSTKTTSFASVLDADEHQKMIDMLV